MGITLWAEQPPGARLPEVYCRGCSAPIWPLAFPLLLWEDANGITVCVKARLEDIGTRDWPGFVLHQPMPAGLVGAPVQAEP